MVTGPPTVLTERTLFAADLPDALLEDEVAELATLLSISAGKDG